MHFFTSLTRMWLTRSVRPFTFKSEYDQALPFAECESLGLYVHIPFCKSICNFCPYCKVRYSAKLCDQYIDSLIQEIHLVGGQHPGRKKATSLYFGGGTPALAANRIKEIVDALGEHFIITEGIGLELHPDNVTVEVLQTLKEAVDAAFTAYCEEYKDAIYCIGSVVGPHPFPMMVRDFQSVVGIEAREQFLDMTGELPDAVVACVGGGSNAMGLFSGFLNDPVDLYGVEPLGRGTKLGDHAASLTYGEEGIMHGFKSIMLKDENGNPAPVYSVASGLDYPSSGPEHAFLHDLGRVKYDVVNDDETLDAFFELSRMEGIIPAIESSHAVAYGMKLAKTMGKGSVLINLSGRGDQDMDYIIEKYGIR